VYKRLPDSCGRRGQGSFRAMALRRRKMCLKRYGYFDNDMLILAMVGELAGIGSQTQSETHRRFSVYARATLKICTFQKSYPVHSNILLRKGIMDSIKPCAVREPIYNSKSPIFQGNFILYLAIKGLKLPLIN
jgi:hypothetical protein